MSLSHLIQNSDAVPRSSPARCIAGDSDVFQTQARSQLELRRPGARVSRPHRRTRTSTSARRSRSDRPTGRDGSRVPDPAITASLNKQLFGIDATFRYRPLRRAIYQRLNLRTELIWSRQDLSTDVRRRRRSAIYGLRRVSVRAALVRRRPRTIDPAARSTASLIDNGGSVFLTFWPSEFSQIRGQYRRIELRRGRRTRTSSCSSSISRSARTARTCSEVRTGHQSCIRDSRSLRCSSRLALASRGVASPRPRRCASSTTTEDLAVARARSRRRQGRGRRAGEGLSGSALRRSEAELHPRGQPRRSADRRRPRAGDRLAAAAHHQQPQREDSAGRAGLSRRLAEREDSRDPDRADHARDGRRAPAGQSALLARSGQRPPASRRRSATSSAQLDRRPTRRTSTSATPTSTSVSPRPRSAGTRRWRRTRARRSSRITARGRTSWSASAST